MTIRKHATALILAALAGGAGPLAAKPAAPRCDSPGIDLGRGVEVIEAVRSYVGADGASHLETVKIPGKTGVYIGGTVKLTQFDLGDPTKVVIVYGYPNIAIPPHPAPYREIFIILSGSSQIRLPSGEVRDLKPGSMFIGEDLGSTTGRGGSSGPCGYVALDLQFKEPAKP